MRKLAIDLKNQSYDIIIEEDALNHLSFYLKNIYHGSKIYIITDDMVASYYLAKVVQELKQSYRVESIEIPHGEASKSLTIYQTVIQALLAKNIHRNELLIGLGGGVVGDLTGFIAATLYRGLPYVNIPTSLLSQLDSSIGGKTGIDFLNHKNVIGAFHQPKLVVIDPHTLATLPQEERNNGMGELIKHALIGNESLWKALESQPEITEDIILASLKVKKRVVELDPYDQKERMLLNFGHTFGHAIELEQNLKHGEAVGLGILMALQLGIDLGVTPADLYEPVQALLAMYQLPHQTIDYHLYLKEILLDKKNLAGILNFILLKKIGEPMIFPLSEAQIKSL